MSGLLLWLWACMVLAVKASIGCFLWSIAAGIFVILLTFIGGGIGMGISAISGTKKKHKNGKSGNKNKKEN